MSEDKIKKIRARYAGYSLNSGNAGKANEDRGWLLAEVDRRGAEIERLRAQIGRLRSKIKWLIEDDERLHYLLYRIANPPPFADCPVEMAQNATRGEHLRREAFDGIRRELEDKP